MCGQHSRYENGRHSRTPGWIILCWMELSAIPINVQSSVVFTFLTALSISTSRTFKLKSSKSMNFSYYHHDRFTPGEYNSSRNLTEGGDFYNFQVFDVGFLKNTLKSDNALNIHFPSDNFIKDTNRIQISELNNPFFLPC